jgi:tRNA wybutosine-synthesizing protein 4
MTQMRGCALLGLEAFPDEEAQRQRFLEAGWGEAESYNMNVLYQRYITQEDRKRIERLQMLDELEEWILINQHYCISWASFNLLADTDWSPLRLLPTQTQ